MGSRNVFLSHEIRYTGTMSLYPPDGERVDIVRITALGLQGSLVIQMPQYVGVDILLSQNHNSLVPSVPISVIPNSAFTIMYRLEPEHRITISYETVVTDKMEMEISSDPDPSPSLTREDIEKIVEEKIESIIGDMTDDDMMKLIQEFKGRGKDA